MNGRSSAACSASISPICRTASASSWRPPCSRTSRSTIMLSRLHRRNLSRFATHEKGMAAVEFALTLPVLLFIFVGVTEVGQAVSISRKVTITTRTVTDLVTRKSSLSSVPAATIPDRSGGVGAGYSALPVEHSECDRIGDPDRFRTAMRPWPGADRGRTTTMLWSQALPSRCRARCRETVSRLSTAR